MNNFLRLVRVCACVCSGAFQRYWLVAPPSGIGEAEAQAQATRAVSKLIFHGCQVPRMFHHVSLLLGMDLNHIVTTLLAKSIASISPQMMWVEMQIHRVVVRAFTTVFSLKFTFLGFSLWTALLSCIFVFTHRREQRCSDFVLTKWCGAFCHDCRTTVFSHSQTVVLCGSCSTVLCQPTGGKARLTEGCSFRKKGE
jgi:small subunit ribosomal protein S27e